MLELRAALFPKINWLKSLATLAVSGVLLFLTLRKSQSTFTQLFELKQYTSLVVLSALSFLPVTLLAAWRWKILARPMNLPMETLTRTYAVHQLSQGFGILTLGGLGADALRWHYMSHLLGHDRKKAFRVLLTERLISLLTLVFLLVCIETVLVKGWWWMGFITPPLLFLLFKKNYLAATLISMGTHSLRALVYFLVFRSLTPQFIPVASDVLHVGLGLIAEVVPVSFEGIGTTHLTLDYFFKGQGVLVVQILLTGKIVFKLLGLLFFPLLTHRKSDA